MGSPEVASAAATVPNFSAAELPNASTSTPDRNASIAWWIFRDRRLSAPNRSSATVIALRQSSERLCFANRAATAPTPRKAKLTVSVSSIKIAMAQSNGSLSLVIGTRFSRGTSTDKEPRDLRNSSGHSSSGSRITRRPTRLAMTSDSPSGNRHSRGSRTAWLPPFWNSFARAAFMLKVYTPVDTLQAATTCPAGCLEYVMPKKIRVDAVPAIVGTLYPTPFDGPCRTRERKKLGDAAGLTQFGVNLLTLPPGAW